MPINAEAETFPNLDTIQDQALAWFARLQDGKATQRDRDDFADWLAANPEHEQAYGKVLTLWQSPALEAAMSHFAAIPLPPTKTSPHRFEARRWVAAACLLLASAWLLHAWGWTIRWQADIVTAAGEQHREILADGSVVVLNTDSAIKLDYAGERRGITLLSGEAYFEVQPDKTRPFVVSTEQGTIRVVGTRFSVKTGGSTQVAVESGIVACTANQGESRQLTAGQRTDVSEQGVADISNVDTGKAFAWLKGRLIFQDWTLADVIAELDRYHPGAIVIADAKLAQIRVSGNYKLEDTMAVVRSLAGIAGAKVIQLSPYLTVLKS